MCKLLWTLVAGVMLTAGCTKKLKNNPWNSSPETAVPTKAEGEIPVSGDHATAANEGQEGEGAAAHEEGAAKTAAKEVATVSPHAEAEESRDNAHADASRNDNKGQNLYNQALKAIEDGQLDNAMALYLTSCQFGWIHSCHRYGWHLERHANPAGARAFYALACTHGIHKSCNNIGTIAEKDGHLQDAKNFYAQACERQNRAACTSLSRIEKRLKGKTSNAH